MGKLFVEIVKKRTTANFKQRYAVNPVDLSFISSMNHGCETILKTVRSKLMNKRLPVSDISRKVLSRLFYHMKFSPFFN